MDAETIRQRLTDIESVFEKIRDHPKTPHEIRGIADFGQGRVANLKAVLASKTPRAGVSERKR